MKILFITDNFPPEVNAPASRTYEHCTYWSKKGYDITVITSFPNFPQGKVYSGYKNSWKKVENYGKIKVIRVWTFMAPNAGVVKRLIDFNSFALRAFFAGLVIDCDIIIATSPQFFTVLSANFLSIIRKVPWIFEVRDLWPESLWMLNKRSFSYRVFSWLELYMYNKASKIIVVTNSFKETLIERGINSEKIEIVFNGVNIESFNPIPRDTSILNKLGISENKIVIGYIGTFGVAQNIPFYVKLFPLIYEKFPFIHFLLIGDGAERILVEQLLKERPLNNVTLLNPIPKDLVSSYTSILDIVFVPLRDEPAYLKVIPSKIFELAAMNKLILLGVKGETKAIIDYYKIGISFEPENIDSFFDALTYVISNESYIIADNTCFKRFCADFSREEQANKMLQVIHSIIINYYGKS